MKSSYNPFTHHAVSTRSFQALKRIPTTSTANAVRLMIDEAGGRGPATVSLSFGLPNLTPKTYP